MPGIVSDQELSAKHTKVKESASVWHLRGDVCKHPRRAEKHHALGKALLDQGKYDEASACFRRALELMPGLTDAVEALQESERLLSESACTLTLGGHGSQIHDIIVFKEGDLELVTSASADGTVRLWSTASGGPAAESLLKHEDQVTSIVWDAARATLAVACLDDTCRLWQRAGAVWRISAELKSASGRFTCMRFLPADQHMITGSAAGALQKWSTSTGDLVIGKQGHGGSITDVALHPIGKLMASSSGDGSCKLWDTATLACLQNLAAECGGVTSCHLAFAGNAGSTSGQHTVLVTTHLDPLRREGRVMLWDIENSGRDGWVDGRMVAQYASIDGFWGAVRLSPVRSPWGLHAVASSEGTQLHVLDLEEACCIFRLEGVPSDIMCISPDGSLVACAGKDSDDISICTIERESMVLDFRLKLSCEGQGVRCLAWSQASDLLISGGKDGACRVWQIKPCVDDQ